MNFIDNLNDSLSYLTRRIKKDSPEILMIAGIAGFVGSTVLACKATLKSKKILEEGNEKIEEARKNNEKVGKIYFDTGVKVACEYAPAVILGGLSIGSVIGSNGIMRKRNASLAAAYALVDKGYKAYRSKVVDRYGEDVDREFYYGKKKETEDEVPDENGEKKKVKTKCIDDCSIYARYFDEYTKDDSGNPVRNWNWKNDPEMNLFFLKMQEKSANDRLRANKFLLLNEVYEMLGLPRTKAGCVMGWIYDPAFPPEDRHVSFGIYDHPDNYSDFVNHNDSILLDFNVSGNVYDLMSDF